MTIRCPYCNKSKSKAGKLFTKKTLKQHVQDRHEHDDEEKDYALDMADLIAGDESDGVYWGIVYEHGYFG